MNKIKLYTEKEYGQLMEDFIDLEELVLLKLLNNNISIDEIPQHLRIRNTQYYIYSHRSCYYLRCERDLKTFYDMLKCLYADIQEATMRDCYSDALVNRLIRKFKEYKREAFSKGEVKKYVLETAEKNGEIDFITRE